jgi:hypothetical protein
MALNRLDSSRSFLHSENAEYEGINEVSQDADFGMPARKIFPVSLGIVLSVRQGVSNLASPLSRKRECTTSGAVFVMVMCKIMHTTHYFD